MFYVPVIRSFLLLSYSLVSIYNAVCLCIPLLMDTWVISRFGGYCEWSCCEYLYTSLPRDIRCHVLWVNGVGLLGHKRDVCEPYKRLPDLLPTWLYHFTLPPAKNTNVRFQMQQLIFLAQRQDRGRPVFFWGQREPAIGTSETVWTMLFIAGGAERNPWLCQ